MLRACAFLSVLCLGMMSYEGLLRGADEAEEVKREPEREPEAPRNVTWSLAIHGGAGSAAETWDEGKRQARLAGLQRALAKGKELLAGGASAVEVVEQVVRIFEDDSHFNAGRGGVLTTAGTAELDASIMDGQTLACGAVGGVTVARHPITLARLVMSGTPHVLLVGPGADAFARQQADAKRIELVTPDYFLSRRHGRSNEEVAPASRPSPDRDDELHYGTVGCVARDIHGHLAAATSTGGTKKKLPGRVGDSPIVGAGTYADDRWCAISGTGIGEEYIRHAVAYDIAAQMRYAGRTLEESITVIMEQRLKPDTGGLIGVDSEGRIVMQHNTPGMSCGAADSKGRFEIKLAADDASHTE